MPRTRIKICGIRDEQSAAVAVEAGADAIGFVFVRGSPRRIEPEAAAAIMWSLPPMVTTVALFKNDSLDRFSDCEEKCPTTAVQLHGNETESDVQERAPGVIKAVRFEADTIAKELKRWDELPEAEAILVDGSPGGQGTAFNWNALADAAAGISTPIIVAGGLDPEVVGEAIRVVRPFAVDVSSGVEGERGVKDHGLIRAFCQAVHEADAKVYGLHGGSPDGSAAS